MSIFLYSSIVPPKKASVFADEAIVVSGAALTRVVSGAQNYAFYSYQATPLISDSRTWSIILDEGGYNFATLGVTDSTSAQVNWMLDGDIILGAQDWYSASVTANVVKSGSVDISTPGRHVLQCFLSGKNASSSNYNLYLTKMWFTPLSD